MRCVVCWCWDMQPKYRAQHHAHRARVEKRSAPGSFGNSRRLTGRGSKRTVFGIGWCALRGVLVGGHATEIQSPATCPLSPRRKTVWTRVVRLKVVGTHRAGQQTAPCSEKAQASRMQLQWSRMGAHLRRAAHGMRGGDFTEKRTSGMSRPTPIPAVPPPGQ